MQNRSWTYSLFNDVKYNICKLRRLTGGYCSFMLWIIKENLKFSCESANSYDNGDSAILNSDTSAVAGGVKLQMWMAL